MHDTSRSGTVELLVQGVGDAARLPASVAVFSSCVAVVSLQGFRIFTWFRNMSPFHCHSRTARVDNVPGAVGGAENVNVLMQTEENLEYWRNEEEKHNPKPERQSAGRQTDRSSISIIRDMARGATSSFRPGSKRVRKSASFFVNDHVKLGDGHRRSTATLNRVVL